MARIRRSNRTVEFGDFQTPLALARQVCTAIGKMCFRPAAVVEPNCGYGSFLLACREGFPDIKQAVGIDINPGYVRAAHSALRDWPAATVREGDFFTTDWVSIFNTLPEPVLVLGNPPWITNSALAAMGGKNAPRKSNFQGLRGIEAISGKANFDISEWMIIRLAEALEDHAGLLAMLCKTSVARRSLQYMWKRGRKIERSSIYHVDAARYFSISAHACLLLCKTGRRGSQDCAVFGSLEQNEQYPSIGLRDGLIAANVEHYEARKHLGGQERYRWRSGIKHDCSKVMELTRVDNELRNGLGERVDVENTFLYPMLKGSQLAQGGGEPKRWMLVTQRHAGDDTSHIATEAPRTWEYLQAHAAALDRRASSLYKNRPRFSLFGIGAYSFAPWKVAISGFYKKLEFVAVGSFEGKPVVLDDTCNFLSCDSEAEALYIAALLNSEPSREFYDSLVFWDSKRPVTVEVLRKLDLIQLEAACETGDKLRLFMKQNPFVEDPTGSLFVA